MRTTEIRCARFSCQPDNQATAIVAVVNYHDGELFDWAAFWGIGTSKDAEQCAQQVAERGAKLYYHDAAFYFSDLPPSKWRK